MLFIGLFCKGIVYKPFTTSLSLVNKNCTKYKVDFITHFCNRLCIHSSAQESNDSNGKELYSEPFSSLVERRRQEAQRSIIVQVQSEQSHGQLNEFCSKFGRISNMYHYTTNNSTMHFILMEFSDRETVNEVMKACGHNDRSHIIPTQSRMLWFRGNQKMKDKSDSSKLNIPLNRNSSVLTRVQLIELLEKAESVNEQIMILYQTTQLDELGTRLRYLTAHQLEAAVSGLFPRVRVLPFGSSANGFGRQGCDLDLVLQLDLQSEEEDSACRLMFHAKPAINTRSQTQRHIDGLADLVQWFLPGCTDVRRILLARVPIVKYRHELTDLECDLSLTNMTAVYMSELLHTFGNLDWRLRPLVFTIRRWAAEVGLTNPSPGRWITNFSLTLLVIFYLQYMKILPSLDTLRQKAGKTDKRISEDGVNCTFLRDVSKLKSSSNTDLSLESLLLGFFDYYAGFDFVNQGISLGTGSPIRKRDHGALYIANPLEIHLNVSQNVSYEETERLKIEFRNAAWELESTEGEDVSENCSEWGLLKLFKENKFIDKSRQIEHLYFSPKRKNSGRLVPVSRLFEDEPDSGQNKSKVTRNLEKTVF